MPMSSPFIRQATESRVLWSAIGHIAAPDECDGTSAVGESRHRIPGVSVGQPTEPCLVSKQRLLRHRKLGTVITAWEQVPVGVGRHLDRGVPQARLHHLRARRVVG
jgi:hypothetical protein